MGCILYAYSIFQIWPQNSNEITFDPLLGPKTIEIWQNGVFSRRRRRRLIDH